MAAIVTVIVGIVGLIVGWLVSGYQNITEKLTEERRSAYLKLLQHADSANDNPEAYRAELQQAAEEASFISRSRPRLASACDGLAT